MRINRKQFLSSDLRFNMSSVRYCHISVKSHGQFHENKVIKTVAAIYRLFYSIFDRTHLTSLQLNYLFLGSSINPQFYLATDDYVVEELTGRLPTSSLSDVIDFDLSEISPSNLKC